MLCKSALRNLMEVFGTPIARGNLGKLRDDESPLLVAICHVLISGELHPVTGEYSGKDVADFLKA